MSGVPGKDDRNEACANCGKHGSDVVKLKNCTACRLVKYCSVDCQKAHRKQHKRTCKRATELKDEQLYSQGDTRGRRGTSARSVLCQFLYGVRTFTHQRIIFFFSHTNHYTELFSYTKHNQEAARMASKIIKAHGISSCIIRRQSCLQWMWKIIKGGVWVCAFVLQAFPYGIFVGLNPLVSVASTSIFWVRISA